MKNSIWISYLFLAAIMIVMPSDARSEENAKDMFEPSAFTGIYRRHPVENNWHVGTVELTNDPSGLNLQWTNEAGASWNLLISSENNVLKTDSTCPYYDNGGTEFSFILQNGKLAAFQFMNETYVRDGFELQTQRSGGLHGYISMSVESPPEGYGYGASFYVGVWSLMEAPLSGFQIGLPSTWIIPDNRDFKEPLCPPGTRARDNWPERGPYYRSVFQTIEGGLGYWASTRFRSSTPKYRINGTPNGYNHEISSPGWGFGRTKALSSEQMGIAQLSNRLLIPPDGITLDTKGEGKYLGNAWMALPLTEEKTGPVVPTGNQCWTLFLNTGNFKGPVAFYIPETWSRLSKGYPTIIERGLDARPGQMGSGAMEVNTVPFFEAEDGEGTMYARIPKIRFSANDKGQSILMQDVKFYAKGAVEKTGRFNMDHSWTPNLRANPLSFRQGKDKEELSGLDQWAQTKVFGSHGKQAFGLQWKQAAAEYQLPQYYRQDGSKRIAIATSDVPASTKLTEQAFDTRAGNTAYTSPAEGIWISPGPKFAPVTATLTDGSTITFAWYRFVDQPAIVAAGWSPQQKERMQKKVELLHRKWREDGTYMPPPSQGALVFLDDAVLVTPPRGMEVGYVPIVIRQEVTLP